MTPPNEPHCRLRLTARRIATALLTCTLALVAIVAGATPSSATTTWVPTTDVAAAGVAYTPRAVFRSDGTAIVAWNTTSGAVKSSVLAEGSTTWAPLPDIVSSGAATSSLIPSLTVRSDDSVVTIWRTASGSLSSAVLAPGSASWTPLNDVAASAAVSPDSVYDGATGRTVAVWRTGVGAVESASLDNGSASWTPLGTLPYTSTNGGVVPTTLSANPLSGRVVAATMASGGVVKAASLPAGGSTWSAMADVSSAGNSGTGPRVGSQPDDTTVVAFRGGDGLVHTAKIAVGEPSWTSLASLATGGSGVSPWMALNPLSGAMILTWINSGVFSAAALEMGSSDWASLGTPTSSGAQAIPAVTVQPGTGRVLASWYTSTGQGKAAMSIGPPGPPSPGSQPLSDSATLDTIGISWTAAQDGGSPVSGYSVDIAPSPSGPWTANPTGCDAVGTGLSCIATGLSAGTSYYFRVNATNAAGAGPYSQVAGPFATANNTALIPILATPTATADGFTTQVTNHDPAWTWGVTSDQGTATIDGAGLITVTGLTPGQTATITVTSSRTGYDPGTATGTGTAATVPGAPPNVTAAITDTTATIAFDPADANGSAITAYTVTANPGGVTCAPNAPFSPPLQCQIAGLTRGTAYTFAVTATNAIGTGPAGTSSPANSADPLPDSAGQPWAALPDGTNPPRRVGPGIAFPVLNEDDIETGTTLSSLTPGVCQVRDSRVFALRKGRCRIKQTTGTVVTTRTIRVGGNPAAATGQVGIAPVTSLYFRPDSATLTRKLQQQLTRAARAIGNRDVIITGNAHDAGTGNADRQLSHRRATNTAHQLEILGIDQVTILTHAYGSTQNGSNPRSNRRVDIYAIG